MSCMSLKTFDSLKLNLTKERFPLVITATGTSMDPIGFTQCTFLINGHSFTQKFIVCTNQTRPVILGKDFSARNCIGVIWTKQGSRKMIDDDNTTIMEVIEQTKDVPLSLANPIRIPPHSIVVAAIVRYTPTWILKEMLVFSENTPISMCLAPTSTTQISHPTAYLSHSPI